MNARFFGDSPHEGRQFMAVCPSRGEVTPAAIISRRCCVFVSVTARAEALRELGFDAGKETTLRAFDTDEVRGTLMGFLSQGFVRDGVMRDQLARKIVSYIAYGDV